MVPRFSLVRPASLPDALAAFAAADGDAAYYAGGTELLQVMKMGFAQFGTLIDLKGLPELRGIEERSDGSLRIGAGTTHREIERSPVVARRLAGLAALERHVANVRVRNAGTIGGNLAFAEPHSDPATFLLACDARVELSGAEGTRTVTIEELIVGPLLTSRTDEEILVAIEVPGRVAGEGRAYDKVAFYERPAASVGVRLRVADGAVADAVVTIGSMTEIPMVVPDAAAALVGAEATDGGVAVAARGAAEALAVVDAQDDHSGSAEYKRHLAGVLLRRAAQAALEEALTDA